MRRALRLAQSALPPPDSLPWEGAPRCREGHFACHVGKEPDREQHWSVMDTSPFVNRDPHPTHCTSSPGGWDSPTCQHPPLSLAHLQSRDGISSPLLCPPPRPSLGTPGTMNLPNWVQVPPRPRGSRDALGSPLCSGKRVRVGATRTKWPRLCETDAASYTDHAGSGLK